VPNRDFALFTQGVENAKALGVRQVFEIDAAQPRLQQFHRFDDLVGVFGVEHQRKAVDAAEVLVQQRLAFHHRQTGFGSNVAQSQDTRAVANDSHGVPFVGVLIHEFGVGLNRAAWRRDAGGVPDCKIVEIADTTFQRCFDFPAIKGMQFHRIRRWLFRFRQQFFFSHWLGHTNHSPLRVGSWRLEVGYWKLDATNDI
jgi:hypothetical protein